MIGLSALPAKPTMTQSHTPETSELLPSTTGLGANFIPTGQQFDATMTVQLSNEMFDSQLSTEDAAEDFAGFLDAGGAPITVVAANAAEPKVPPVSSFPPDQPYTARLLVMDGVPALFAIDVASQGQVAVGLGDQLKTTQNVDRHLPAGPDILYPSDATAQILGDVGSAVTQNRALNGAELRLAPVSRTPEVLSKPAETSVRPVNIDQIAVAPIKGDQLVPDQQFEAALSMPSRPVVNNFSQSGAITQVAQSSADERPSKGPLPEVTAQPVAPNHQSALETGDFLKADRMEALLPQSMPGRSTQDLGIQPLMPAKAAALSPDRAVGQSIASQVAFAITKTGSDTVEIRLDPPELGHVRVYLTTMGDTVSAQLSADRSEIADMMRRHGDLLHRELNSSGFKGITLDFGSTGHEPDRGSSQDAPDASDEQELIAEADEPLGPADGLVTTSSLNLRL